MNIFISWSGTASKAVAEALRSWIPRVIQSARPWLSSTDIESGARWSPEVEEQLRKCTAGILCMTSDNVVAPWLLFEAGALSKTVGRPFVCPYLLDLEPSDLRAPLSLFQARRANHEDTFALMSTINGGAPENQLSREGLEDAFEAFWKKLETALGEARKLVDASDKIATRDPDEMIQEILELVRGQERRLADLADLQRRARIPGVGKLAERLFISRGGHLERQGPTLETEPKFSVDLGLGENRLFTLAEYEGLLASLGRTDVTPSPPKEPSGDASAEKDDENPDAST